MYRVSHHLADLTFDDIKIRSYCWTTGQQGSGHLQCWKTKNIQNLVDNYHEVQGQMTDAFKNLCVCSTTEQSSMSAQARIRKKIEKVVAPTED